MEDFLKVFLIFYILNSMKETINLIILPLYRTENEYSFSVFNNLDNLHNTLSLEWLEENLSYLSRHFEISKISIEGGEISLLSDIYFDLLFRLLGTYNKKISITTDFMKFNRSLIDNADVINVLYNFNHNSEIVFKNIKAAISTGKVITIKSLDIFVQDNALDKISTLNRLKIKSWKIIPYQKTRSQIENTRIISYSDVINKYINQVDYMQFSFLNKLELEGIIKLNNFPINTVYITPNNKFGLGCIDNQGYFFIEEFEDLIELEKKLKSYQSQQILLCEGCKYQSECLADRYFDKNILTKTTCSGYKDLIKLNRGK